MIVNALHKFMRCKNSLHTGLTLIETIIYASMLPMLLVGFIYFIYVIQTQDQKLFDDVQAAQNL